VSTPPWYRMYANRFRSSSTATSASCFSLASCTRLVSDQGVGHFGERGLNRFLVLHHRAVPLGFRQPHIRPEPACRKDRLAELWNEAPGAIRSAEKAGQLSALPAE
jgi:hypothetical protein